eukprot:6199206-Pleurochrysis_carterae.AAC.1
MYCSGQALYPCAHAHASTRTREHAHAHAHAHADASAQERGRASSRARTRARAFTRTRTLLRAFASLFPPVLLGFRSEKCAFPQPSPKWPEPTPPHSHPNDHHATCAILHIGNLRFQNGIRTVVRYNLWVSSSTNAIHGTLSSAETQLSSLSCRRRLGPVQLLAAAAAAARVSAAALERAEHAQPVHKPSRVHRRRRRVPRLLWAAA